MISNFKGLFPVINTTSEILRNLVSLTTNLFGTEFPDKDLLVYKTTVNNEGLTKIITDFKSVEAGTKTFQEFTQVAINQLFATNEKEKKKPARSHSKIDITASNSTMNNNQTMTPRNNPFDAFSSNNNPFSTPPTTTTQNPFDPFAQFSAFGVGNSNNTVQNTGFSDFKSMSEPLGQPSPQDKLHFASFGSTSSGPLPQNNPFASFTFQHSQSFDNIQSPGPFNNAKAQSVPDLFSSLDEQIQITIQKQSSNPPVQTQSKNLIFSEQKPVATSSLDKFKDLDMLLNQVPTIAHPVTNKEVTKETNKDPFKESPAAKNENKKNNDPGDLLMADLIEIPVADSKNFSPPKKDPFDATANGFEDKTFEDFEKDEFFKTEFKKEDFELAGFDKDHQFQIEIPADLIEDEKEVPQNPQKSIDIKEPEVKSEKEIKEAPSTNKVEEKVNENPASPVKVDKKNSVEVQEKLPIEKTPSQDGIQEPQNNIEASLNKEAIEGENKADKTEVLKSESVSENCLVIEEKSEKVNETPTSTAVIPDEDIEKKEKVDAPNEEAPKDPAQTNVIVQEIKKEDTTPSKSGKITAKSEPNTPNDPIEEPEPEKLSPRKETQADIPKKVIETPTQEKEIQEVKQTASVEVEIKKDISDEDKKYESYFEKAKEGLGCLDIKNEIKCQDNKTNDLESKIIKLTEEILCFEKTICWKLEKLGQNVDNYGNQLKEIKTSTNDTLQKILAFVSKSSNKE